MRLLIWAGADAERGQLGDHADPLGGGQPGAVLVLGPLGDQPLDLGGVVAALVGGDDDRHGCLVGGDGGQGAAVPEAHPQPALGSADGDDGHQHAELADAGDEVGVDAGVVAHVDVDQQRAQVDLLHGAGAAGFGGDLGRVHRGHFPACSAPTGRPGVAGRVSVAMTSRSTPRSTA